MKHTIKINTKNNTQHIIHLDQHLPITITKLPPNQAYQIQDTPIHTTTTQTLNQQTIHQIRQKNKQITQPTHILIIQNTTKTPHTKIQTIQENPMITTHTTKKQNITKTLQKKHNTLTPPPEKPTTTQDNTLYHNNTPIKTYKNKEYLTHIKNILNNNPTLTLQQAEYKAQQKYYQYISYDKKNQTYKLTIPHKHTSTHKKLEHAIQEKNTLNNTQDKEEETLCQNNHTTPEPLPPTPWNNKQHNTPRKHNKYHTQHDTKHNNPDTTQIINTRKTQKTQILNTTKPDRNINKKTKNTYRIQKTKNNKKKTYYTTKNKTQARYIRDKLEQNQYQLTPKQIKKYQQQYQNEKQEYKQQYQEKYKTIDYYQQTTTKLTQQKNKKTQYQQNQIKKNKPKNFAHPQKRKNK